MRRIDRKLALEELSKYAAMKDYETATQMLGIIDRTTKEEKRSGKFTDTIILHNQKEEMVFRDLLDELKLG